MSKVRRGSHSNNKNYHDREVGKRSLTPTTHVYRDLYTDFSDLQNHVNLPRGIHDDTVNDLRGLETVFYVDTYTNFRESVFHFGINASSTTVTSQITTINSSASTKKLPSIQSSRAAAGQQQSGAVDLTTYRAEAAKQLLDCEKDIVNFVIQQLKHSTDTRTALIDLFARAADGKIPSSETHTVVLWKQNEKYLVIDPNNSEFSRLLAGANNDIRICSKQMQIYKVEGSTGQGSNLWRDCIDIAVKIALSLDFHKPDIRLDKEDLAQNTGFIDAKSLQECIVIKDLTNNCEIYKKLPVILEKIPSRLKQSTDMKEAKKVSTYTKALKYLGDQVAQKDQLDLYHALQLSTAKVVAKLQDSSPSADVAQLIGEFKIQFKPVLGDTTDFDAMLGIELAAIDGLY